MGCAESVGLEEAVRREWKGCDTCHFFICGLCFADLGDAPPCLSYLCQRSGKPLLAGAIPVEKVLFFAGHQVQQTERQGLLYRLFYEEREDLDLPFTLVEMAEEEEDDIRGPLTLQEEVWQNHRLVVTRRRRGKFVSWEKIL